MAAPVASLPMYDWPEIAWANDALWQAIATRLHAAGVKAPAAFDRDRPHEEVWRDKGLVLSQTCGFPFSTRLRGIVRLVGVPVYNVPGCDGGHYSSVVAVRRDEAGDDLAAFAGRRVAYNAADSLSGFVALRAAMREVGLDPAHMDWIETGGHRNSIRAVAEGRADVAAIDAVCWGLAGRHEPEAVAALKVVAHTPLRPGLPLITAIERSDAEVVAIRAAVKAALADPATEAARRETRIAGLSVFDEWHYSPIAALARHAD